MNKIYSKVWNKELGQLVVASEFARSDSTGVVQGAGAATLLRRSLLAAVIAPMLTLAGFGSALAEDLVLDPDASFTVGHTVIDASGVAIGSNVHLDSTGLVITGGPSVTLAGINAGNNVITNVANGTVDHHAVNLGQLNQVSDAVSDNTSAITANSADIATNAANISANADEIEAVRTTASAGWDISAEGGDAANVSSGGAVDFSGDGNIEVARTGTSLTFSLSDEIEVESIAVGGMTLDADGIDAGGNVITNLANGEISQTSTDAVTGQQVHDLFFEQGTAFGVRYFRANSTENDSLAEGQESIAIGPNTVAEGDSSFAAGDGAIITESGEGAIAVGQGATAGGELSGGTAAIAIGRDSEATSDSAVALGDGASAGGANATALGAGAEAGGASGVALGQDAVAAAQNNISIGTAAGEGTGQVLPGDQSHNIAIGNASGQNVAGQFNVAMGDGAGSGVEGDDNVAFGRGAGTGITGHDNVSLGMNANAGANANRAVSIGESTSAETEAIAIGFSASAGTTGVALGRQTTALGTGTAIGSNAHADSNFVALGLNSWATQSDVSGSSVFTNRSFSGGAVSVGSSQDGAEFTRRIVNVEDGAQDTDAVNVRQLKMAVEGIDLGDVDFAEGVIANLQDQIDQNMLNYVSINDGGVDKGNKNNNGADANAIDSVAIGPDATTKNQDSIAIGHHAGAEGDSAVVIGHNIKGLGENSTTIGNSQSEAHGESGIAIGTHVESRDENSIVIGRDSYTNRQANGPAVDNSIVIGTQSSSTAVEGIVIGKDAVVNASRGIAQGSAAHATAGDAMAFGTQARASGASSQASGRNASAHRPNAIATGTNATGWANDGIAMGTGAVAGIEDPANQEPRRNMGGIAIGQSTLANDYHALALGVEARATDESATAIGDGAEASAEDALAVGSESRSAGENASAFGQGADAQSLNSLAVGSDASAYGNNASAVGPGATAMGTNALSVGAGARAEGQNTSAFGQGAQATNPNSVALGAGSVTDNPFPTSSGTINDITYGGFAGDNPGSVVSVGAQDAERQISNVAAGRISPTSTDAINGSQLFATQTVIGNVAHSTADILGGNADVGSDGTITMNDVGGTGYGTVHEAIEYAAQGWDVGVNGATGENVAPGGSVDFSNTDENIVIARDGTDLTFDLADDLEIGNSITTNNLTVEGDTQLGDHFTVNEGGVFYDGPITEGDHIVNKTYVDGEIDALANTPLTFAGDAGDNVDRLLGQTVNLVGGAEDEAALTDGNIGVFANGDDTLEIKLNKDIDLGEDGSLAIGDAELDNEGLVVDDGDSSTTIGAGSIDVADADGNVTSIGGTQVEVGGTNAITIDGDAGTIEGLANVDLDGDDFAQAGRAATEEQLDLVNQTANAGWNLTGSGEDEVNIGPNGSVDFQGDQNITVAQIGEDQDGVIQVTLNRELDVDRVTAGDSVLDTDGLVVTDDDGNATTVAADDVTVTDGDASTSIGAGVVTVAGSSSTIVIDGDTGTIGGLTNQTIDYPDFADGTGRAATEDQLDLVNQTANAGWNLTGEGDDQVNIGPNGSVDFQGDQNITVAQTGEDQEGVIQVALNRELDVDSVTAGDSVLDTDGLVVTDDDGNVTTVAADGTTVEDDEGNSTTVAAGDVTVTDGDASTSIGAGVVTVAGANSTIVIDGDAGTIGGLTNTTFDPDAFTSGQAATEDQLSQVHDVATAGWNLTGEGDDQVNIGPNGSVDFQGDQNITVAQTGDDQEGVIQVALNRELDVDSVTAGDSVLDTDGLVVTDDDGNVTTVAADGTTVEDDEGNSTTVAAGEVTVTDGDASTSIGAGVVTVAGSSSTIVIDGDAGTIGGLTNQTIDYPDFADGSGRAATEEQLDLVNQTANAGWNLTGSGEDEVNIGPNGSVDFQGDQNITVAQTGEDQEGVIQVALNRDLDVDSVTAGDTIINTTGVAIGTDVHLGNTGLVIAGGPSVTVAGIDAGNLVITNVAPGEISATSTDAINGSQLHGMGDSIVNVIGGNAELNPDGTIVTSDIGGTGHDNIDDAIRSANDAANAGWTATDADGNAANIGPNGSVNFTGDGNISVAQTGDDNSGEIEITLNRDLDVDSITAGDTVIDTDGVRVGDDVHLGDTGLVIEGGPSVTTEGIDAGGSTITNVAAGVNDTDAANVGQLNQVAGDVNDLGDRMDVVEGDVSDLQAGAAGPFQVSQEAPLVPPTPTGENSAAGGSGADASGDNSTALGNQAVASGANSTAVGQGAQATHDNSVALGQGSETTVGAQSGYDAAYVGSSSSSGEVNVGNRTVSGVAPGVAGNDAVNVNQLNAGVNHAVVTANEYTDQRINQVQGDVWHLHGRVDDLEKSINSGVATAMAMRQAPYVAGATTYYAGFGAYKDQGALGVSLRRTSDNGRWSLEGGFSANREGTGGYIGVSGVLGSK